MMIRRTSAAIVPTIVTVVLLVGVAIPNAANARTARVLTTPHTYVVNPGGTGATSLSNVLANLVQPGDTVMLADGVYPVQNLTLSQPNVTIRAQHMPAAGAPPTAWLDGSIPYLYWSQPHPGLWTHPYTKDFCNETLPHLPCAQGGLPYHSDQVFKGGDGVQQTLSSSDLGGSAPRFYVDSTNHMLDINFDPGIDTTVTDKETALVFASTATNSVLEGLGVRKYAGNDHNASDLAIHQDTAVYVGDATGAILRDDYFSFNSVRGVKTQGNVPSTQTPVAGAHVVVDGDTFDHNGELGLDSVDSDDILVEHSLFYRNNTKHYYEGAEAGGAKLLCTWGADITDNVFREQDGIGLWFDRSSYDATVSDNLFQGNSWNGVKYEVSAHAVITGNTAIGNGQAALLVYESSQVSFSHNLLRGNLVGIEVQEGLRTWLNNPSNRDSDPDRVHPADLTFDVKDIDIHANGFYYAPSPHTYVVCNPSAPLQNALDGCEYQIVAEDDLAQRDAAVLDIVATHDNFHRQNWPSDPLHAKVPTFIAMWQARPETASTSGCAAGASSSRQLRWVTLPDFQCTGQENGAATPF
ncbi:MAG TPA: right-handed parallel beta-helix repeat-containing protein [Acidimicrobiia bacterium]|jgi:parallel beta-helix repeat protein